MSEKEFRDYLLNGYRAKFDSGYKLWKNAICIERGLVLIAILGLFTPPSVAYPLALISFLLLIWAYLRKYQSAEAKDAGENGRRAFLLADGLDFRFEGKARSDIISDLPKRSDLPIVTESANYFSNSREPGAARLLLDIQESAFWTRHIADAAFWRELGKASVFPAALFFLLVMCVNADSLNLRIQAAQCILISITTAISGEHIHRLLAFFKAKNQADSMDQKLENLNISTFDEKRRMANVALLLGDYNSLVASIPHFDNTLHKAKQEELNTLWKERLASLQSESKPKEDLDA